MKRSGFVGEHKSLMWPIIQYSVPVCVRQERTEA